METSQYAYAGNERPRKGTTVTDNQLRPDFTEYDNILFGEGLTARQLRKGVDSLLEDAANASESKGLFTVRTARRWMEQAQNRPIPQMLLGELWFESELCILFADTNLGKSILAVQTGNSISQGNAILGLQFQAQKQPVLYVDFELTDKQFEYRYSIEYSQHYSFDEGFIRAEINPDSTLPDNTTFEDFLNLSLERAITETGARVLIIDNLTYLRNETERAKDALPLMKHLKALKSRYGLSILCLAHTPKRDLSKPLTRNDLQGSKMLINFCDSCFTIGESSQDKHVRYIKQIKARNTEIIYDAENVILCQISKPANFLQFERVGFGSERDHLRQQTEQDKAGLSERIKEVYQRTNSLRATATELGVSHQTVSRYLKKP